MAALGLPDNINGDIYFPDSVHFEFVQILFEKPHQSLVTSGKGEFLLALPCWLGHRRSKELFRAHDLDRSIRVGRPGFSTKISGSYLAHSIPVDNRKRIIRLAH